jgi:hypothetical protein
MLPAILRPVICAFALCAALMAVENIIPEGTITEAGGHPRGWTVLAGQPDWMLSRYRVISDDDRTFARCENGPAMIEVAKPIDAARVKQVAVTYAFRLAGFKQGANAWDVPYLELNFRDQAGKTLLNHKAQYWESKDTEGWAKRSQTAAVPAGATTVLVSLGFKAAAGKADWADIVVAPAK